MGLYVQQYMKIQEHDFLLQSSLFLFWDLQTLELGRSIFHAYGYNYNIFTGKFISSSATELIQADILAELVEIKARTLIETNSNWLKQSNYDTVTTTVVGNITTLSYFEDTTLIAVATYTFAVDGTWTYVLEHYLNEDDGSILLEDDGSNLTMD